MSVPGVTDKDFETKTVREIMMQYGITTLIDKMTKDGRVTMNKDGNLPLILTKKDTANYIMKIIVGDKSIDLDLTHDTSDSVEKMLEFFESNDIHINYEKCLELAYFLEDAQNDSLHASLDTLNEIIQRWVKEGGYKDEEDMFNTEYMIAKSYIERQNIHT